MGRRDTLPRAEAHLRNRRAQLRHRLHSHGQFGARPARVAVGGAQQLGARGELRAHARQIIVGHANQLFGFVHGRVQLGNVGVAQRLQGGSVALLAGVARTRPVRLTL